MGKKKKKNVPRVKPVRVKASLGNSQSTTLIENDGPLAVVLAEQRRGNRAFKSGQFHSALFHYTHAISLIPLQKELFHADGPPLAQSIRSVCVSLLLNRALTCIRLRAVESVITDAKYTLFLDAHCVRAHILLFFAYKHLQRLKSSHFHLMAAIDLLAAGHGTQHFKAPLPLATFLRRHQELINSQIKKYDPSAFTPSSELLYAPLDPFRPGCPIDGADDFGLFEVEGATALPTDPQLLYISGEIYPSKPTLAHKSPSFCICDIEISCSSCLVCNDPSILTLSPIFYPPSTHPDRLTQASALAPSSTTDDDLPPPLIPVGEHLSLHTYHADYLPEQLMSGAASLAKAQSEKAAGNDAFTKGPAFYHQALFHYSRAIQLHPSDPIFYSNRALVYLKLERHQECISDCTTALAFAKSIKLYHRRAAAWMSLGEFQRAICDYKRALAMENNSSCASELDKALAMLVQQRQELLDQQLAKLNQHDPKKSKTKAVFIDPIDQYHIESLKFLLRDVQLEQEARKTPKSIQSLRK